MHSAARVSARVQEDARQHSTQCSWMARAAHGADCAVQDQVDCHQWLLRQRMQLRRCMHHAKLFAQSERTDARDQCVTTLSHTHMCSLPVRHTAYVPCQLPRVVCTGQGSTGRGARPPGSAGYLRVRGTSRTCCVLRRVCTRHMHCICTTPCQPPMRGTERAADHRASLCPPAPSVMHSQSRHVWPSVGFATYVPSTLTCVSLRHPVALSLQTARAAAASASRAGPDVVCSGPC